MRDRMAQAYGGEIKPRIELSLSVKTGTVVVLSPGGSELGGIHIARQVRRWCFSITSA